MSRQGWKKNSHHSPSVMSVMLLLLLLASTAMAFTPASSSNSRISLSSRITGRGPTRTSLWALKSTSKPSRDGRAQKKKKPSKKQQPLTLAQLRERIQQNPAKYEAEIQKMTQKSKKNKYRRSRKRAENPQQTYIYKSQRERQQQATTSNSDDDDTADADAASDEPSLAVQQRSNHPNNDAWKKEARALGLQVGLQQVDAPMLEVESPQVMGRIRVMDDSSPTTAGSYAYVIDKPAGWSILGSSSGKKQPPTAPKIKTLSSNKSSKRRVKVKPAYTGDDGIVDDDEDVGSVVEYDLKDVLALLTPEELEELQQDSDGDDELIEYLNEGSTTSTRSSGENMYDPDDQDFDEESSPSTKEPVSTHDVENNVDDQTTAANLRRIAARREQASANQAASFAVQQRPSVVAWLKQTMADAGTPIRGGTYWTALAGATAVDDSGLVLLCPKACVQNVGFDTTEYVAVAGTGGFLAPRRSTIKSGGAAGSTTATLHPDSVELNVLAKLRKGREDVNVNDVVQAVQVVVPDRPSACSNVVDLVQSELQQGIRGDPAANAFDRRARRRLMHCSAMSVSSLLHHSSSDDEDGDDDETMVEARIEELPSDMAVLVERRGGASASHKKFQSGSFVGRSSLQKSPLTTAYREINGVADGFPGWIVDRYDKWLFIQHQRDARMASSSPKGPIPSIHDGNTAGVYYLESSPDRSAMGSTGGVRPRLLEGQPAPEKLMVLENGVKYIVSLDKDLSTGIFLDQRPQRAWLRQNCCEATHVLNCFAHTGAFSVAAAAAGASTVSLDLSKKWLDRLPEHLEANGIPFDERHDSIFGDCFDWLARLSKRGEKYDIVILDPPSSSVGRKKKRWSVKNDMDDLVALAAPLVKRGGLLWTTTNSATMHPIKFAKLCRQGLENAGIESFRLERIQPMPHDHPTVGPQTVKNLVWRL